MPLQLAPLYENNATISDIVTEGNQLSRKYISELTPSLPEAHIGWYSL